MLSLILKRKWTQEVALLYCEALWWHRCSSFIVDCFDQIVT